MGKSIVASHFFQGMIQTGKVCNDDAYFQNINKLYIMMGILRQLHDLLHYIVLVAFESDLRQQQGTPNKIFYFIFVVLY